MDSRIKESVPRITGRWGNGIPFRQHIEENDAGIYDMWVATTLEVARAYEADPEDVKKYLAPIVERILYDSARWDKFTYMELVAAVQVAYAKLRERLERLALSYEDGMREFILEDGDKDIMKSLEGLMRELAAGQTVLKIARDEGRYRIVVGPGEMQEGKRK